MSAQPGTDWDNLEGDDLNVALAKVAGIESDRCFDCYVSYYQCERCNAAPYAPDYANSIDAQKRDLEPLLEEREWVGAAFGFDSEGALEWFAGVYPMRGGESSRGKSEPLARARCLGMALEARQ